MKTFAIGAAVAWLAFSATATLGQTPPAAPADPAAATQPNTAPRILNPSAGSGKPTAPATTAREPYAGQQPAATSAPAAASDAKATATPSTVPEGPPVKPIAKPAGAVPAQPKAAEQKAVGQKLPAPEPKSTEAKSAEQKPADVDAKTAEPKSAERKATEPKATATPSAVPEGPAAKPVDKAATATAPASSTADAKEPAVTAPKPPPPKPTLNVAIDLTNQRLTVAENGVPRFKWNISSGRTGYVTPKGTFRPIWMTKMWYSRKYDYAPMPHAIFFHGGTAIHGTDSLGALGRPASHGCVRLAPANAATLYALVTKHGKQKTEIKVFGTPKQGPAVASRDAGAPRGNVGYRRFRAPTWDDYDDADYDRPPPRRRVYSDRYYDRDYIDRPYRPYPRYRRYPRDFDPYDYDD